ncbi:MAG: hypothetical protein RR725_01395 [Carnobacterium sp.]|nr:hypothetical protein NY10_2343 [Carnobacterium sp. CP1]
MSFTMLAQRFLEVKLLDFSSSILLKVKFISSLIPLLIGHLNGFVLKSADYFSFPTFSPIMVIFKIEATGL